MESKKSLSFGMGRGTSDSRTNVSAAPLSSFYERHGVKVRLLGLLFVSWIVYWLFIITNVNYFVDFLITFAMGAVSYDLARRE